MQNLLASSKDFDLVTRQAAEVLEVSKIDKQTGGLSVIAAVDVSILDEHNEVVRRTRNKIKAKKCKNL